MDYINDTLLGLPENEKLVIKQALNIASQSGQSWRTRYKLANDGLVLLGAKKKKGDKISETLYAMPCGCIYRLYYAVPICEKYCSDHFLEKETIPSFVDIIYIYIKNIIFPMLFVVSVVATIVMALDIVFNGINNDLYIFIIYLVLAISSYLIIINNNEN